MSNRDWNERRHKEHLASVGRRVGYLFHQVRSPVVTMGLLARSLRRRETLSDAGRKQADQIVEHGCQIESMLNACLDYLRPTRDGGERVNVANLVDWVHEQVAPQADEAKVALEVDLAGDLPVLFGHRRLLREALLNVVHNAVEAAAEDGSAVTVHARSTGKHLVLEVSDDGGGMPPDVAAEACEPFMTTKPRGTGLGLALTRKVVEGHGGRVDIHSTSGEGTSVKLFLPIGGCGRGRGDSSEGAS